MKFHFRNARHGKARNYNDEQQGFLVTESYAMTNTAVYGLRNGIRILSETLIKRLRALAALVTHFTARKY